jgi:6-phosphofructokinase 1
MFVMHRIGVLTSGGDSPAMNAFVRAVVRRGLSYDMEVFGIRRGYEGLIEDDIDLMGARSVGGIINRAGTILGTARCPEFKTKKGQREALRNLNKHGIEGLVVLGGDGSLRGAMALHEQGVKVVGAPGTIDNDMCGTTMTIGVDSALNIALQAVDMIKATASSHRRAFLIEVMGNRCGYLALMTGIAGGVEMICIPEVPFELADVACALENAYIRGKAHCIIVVAEGAAYNARAIEKYLYERTEETGFEEVRSTILGYIQRGAPPTAFDRLLATRLGAAAVDLLHEDKNGVMVGLGIDKVITTPIAEVVAGRKEVDLSLFELAKSLGK